MNRPRRQPRKRKPAPRATPVGEAIDWSDEEIDKLAQVTADDVRIAGVTWRRHASKRAKGLLDAEPQEEQNQ